MQKVQKSEQEEVYIGIDLGSEWTQISYFWPGMKEPETVSMVAGEQKYRIPTALYRPAGSDTWYLPGSKSLKEEPGSLYLEDLWGKSLRGETVRGPMARGAKDLFLLFLRKVLRLVPELTEFSQIRALAFHMQEISVDGVQLLKQMGLRIGVDIERVFVYDDGESFCHFAMNQEKDLKLHDMALFVCEGDALICYYLEKDNRTSPPKTAVSVQELGSLPTDPQKRDQVFAQQVNEALKRKIISGVYLVGDGLEGGWMKESVPVLCRGRRAFQGKNLFTKGACYGSFVELHEKNCGYTYSSEYKLKNNVLIRVRNGNRSFFVDLAEAGNRCYELGKSCQVLLDQKLHEEAGVDLWLQAPDGVKARIESLVLTDLQLRPPKSTRLLIEAMPAEKRQILIRITDLGFGAWYPSSGKVWEYCIEEEG